MTLFVGLDTGLTSTKAAVFADDGRVISVATAPTPHSSTTHSSSMEDRRERDPYEHWKVAAGLLSRVVGHPAVDSHDIAAVAIAGHGDGLFLVDAQNQPVRPAVLSSDTRAAAILHRWSAEAWLPRALALGGAIPFAGSPAPLLRWFLDNEPSTLASARWMLPAKDWLRLCLTGHVASDPTDAPSSFYSAQSWDYSESLLDLYGMSGIGRLLPPILPSTGTAGEVTREAAASTGLRPGTPVITGLHDVAASHLGAAGQQSGHAVLIAGTFGVDLTLVDRPIMSTEITCRPGPRPGQWTLRRTSLASGANVVWAVDRLMAPMVDGEDRIGTAIELALADAPPNDQPIFLPYLFGGSGNAPRAASLLGIRAEHTTVDLLRAVIFGVTMNHRFDLDQLGMQEPISAVHLTGGAARSVAWAQLFADTLGLPVQVSSTEQSAALGATICAAVGVGSAPDLAAAFSSMRRVGSTIFPREDLRTRMDGLYDEFVRHFQSQLPDAGPETADHVISPRTVLSEPSSHVR